MINDHSRRYLATRVGNRCKAKYVVVVLEGFTCLYLHLELIHIYNGPPFSPRFYSASPRPASPPALHLLVYHPHGEVLCQLVQRPFRDELPSTEQFTRLRNLRSGPLVGVVSTKNFQAALDNIRDVFL